MQQKYLLINFFFYTWSFSSLIQISSTYSFGGQNQTLNIKKFVKISFILFFMFRQKNYYKR